MNRLNLATTVLLSCMGCATAFPAWSLTIDSATWDDRRNRLTVTGTGENRETVTVVNAFDTTQELGTDRVGRDGEWRVRASRPNPVPCAVTASAASGAETRDVLNAPPDCAPAPGGNNAPVANADNYSTDEDTVLNVPAPGVLGNDTDADGDALTVSAFDATSVQGATVSVNPDGSFSYDPTGAAALQALNNGDSVNDTFNYTVSDGNGGTDTAVVTVAVAGLDEQQQACNPADLNISINSTSQNGCPDATIPQQAIVPNTTYSVLAINDLGMHCGDLDTRIASILPPFQVLLAQVIQKGSEPTVNPPGVSVFYSAASNQNDPALALTGFDGVMANGDTYKTNFWDFPVPAGTYDAFYPAFNPLNPAQTLTPLAGPPFNVTHDIGLPVPNVEEFYIGEDGLVDSCKVPNAPASACDGTLTAVLHAMPGIAGPYTVNDPKLAQEHYGDKPFFLNFPFGYVAEDVNWYEGAGIPFAAFDDNGRENAYPLVRVQARNAQGQVLSTVDTVLPISGEASCTNCHAEPADFLSVSGTPSRTNGPTQELLDANLPVALSMDDPDANLPPRVSLEYAADINVLRLHDLKHGASYVTPSAANDSTTDPAPCDITANGGNGDENCLTNKALVQEQPVVCQVCHYTPALDLAQLGPLTGPAGSIANGRNQLGHESNSRVMHNHHGQFANLFTPIPPPAQNPDGSITNQAERLAALEDSCYQCHPGTNVQCLRGAMFNGGMLCNDCHGGMEQVGADFSAGVSPTNPGAFILDLGNFYDPNSDQPRVPWANEPGCGSCHTGDVRDNLAGSGNVRVNTRDTFGNVDGIRLRQAYRNGDGKATPIVPTNKRFAEPAVPASFNGFANPGAGNPQLYRVSTGHGGVMCEGCHGATHAEWPNANPNANDNVTANQLQGHTGTIIECTTCHGNTMNNRDTLGGPHGMHPVGDNTGFADGGHEDLAEDNPNACRACHGNNGQGSVLSRAAADRDFRGLEDGGIVLKGEPVTCTECHENEL